MPSGPVTSGLCCISGWTEPSGITTGTGTGANPLRKLMWRAASSTPGAMYDCDQARSSSSTSTSAIGASNSRAAIAVVRPRASSGRLSRVAGRGESAVVGAGPAGAVSTTWSAPVVSAMTTSRSIVTRSAPAGRAAGSCAVIAVSRCFQWSGSGSGTTGSRESRATADSTSDPGNSRRRVKHCSRTRPSE
nr:hypothetical protein [Curtobacterium sp. B18]